MAAKQQSGRLVRNWPWTTDEALQWRLRKELHQTFIQSINIGVISEGFFFESKAAAGAAAAAAAALAALAVFEQPEPTIISTPQPSEEQVDWDPEITTTEEPAVAEPSRPEETRPDRSEPQEGQEPKLQSKVATEHPPHAQQMHQPNPRTVSFNVPEKKHPALRNKEGWFRSWKVCLYSFGAEHMGMGTTAE
jgi:hypothetical protein